MRTSDAHILTVDRYTFIADERFQILPGDSWTLLIKSVTLNDTDFYECQISTAPKLAFRTHLQVLVPTIRYIFWQFSLMTIFCNEGIL